MRALVPDQVLAVVEWRARPREDPHGEHCAKALREPPGSRPSENPSRRPRGLRHSITTHLMHSSKTERGAAEVVQLTRLCELDGMPECRHLPRFGIWSSWLTAALFPGDRHVSLPGMEPVT
jgi:hypothetical protein